MHSLSSASSSCYVNPSTYDPQAVLHNYYAIYISFIYSPLCQIHIADSYVCTSEASHIEADNTTADADGCNTTKHVNSGMHATAYHIADIPHNSNVLPNSTETSELCGSTIHGNDLAHETYIPLTRQALQQHNTKHTSPNSDKVTQCSLGQNYVHGISFGYTAVDTSILPADHYAEEERDFCSHTRPQLFMSAISIKEDEHKIGFGAGHPHQPIEHQCFHPYPVVIHQGDVNHQMEQVEFDYQEPLLVKQEMLQAWTSCGNALAGVGTQFSG